MGTPAGAGDGGEALPNSGFKIHDFRDSGLLGFRNAGLQDFSISRFQTRGLQDVRTSDFRTQYGSNFRKNQKSPKLNQTHSRVPKKRLNDS